MTGQPSDIGILFADITGSTRLYEELGDEASLEAVTRCFKLMTHAVITHGGAVVRTLGDEVMAKFDRPENMVSAAIVMQGAISALPPLQGPKGTFHLLIRVGFHFGPAIEESGDYYGDSVNTAARMSTLARPGQIITTDSVRDLIPLPQRVGMRDLGPFAVKGKAQPVRAVEVIWQNATDMTVVNLPAFQTGAARRGLEIRDGVQLWLFPAERDSIAIGRETGCDVVLSDQQASRRHATIERRQGNWVLVDHSTNGTFVTFAGESEIRVSRDELILQRPGTISFGQPSVPGHKGLSFAFV